MRVLITGASDGIGGAAAIAIAEAAKQRGEEARMVLSTTGRKPAPQAVLDRLESLRAKAHYLPADLTDVEACKQLAAQAVDTLGGLDSFISNAGALGPAPLKEIDAETWDFQFDVNVRPTLLIAQGLHAALSESGGSIVATSSMTGEAPMPGSGGYSASKAAVSMLIRQIAQEWGPDGIRANAVAPGMIRTGLTEAAYSHDETHEARAGMVPLRRIGTPEEMGAIIAFLAGPQSAYVTGQIITADGGVVEAMLGRIPAVPKN